MKRKRGEINKAHPELREGEVFLTNASDDCMRMGFRSLRDRYEEVDYRSGWDAIGWKTKRRGIAAYDVFNNPIDGMFPVFVQREELVRAGINPDTLGK